MSAAAFTRGARSSVRARLTRARRRPDRGCSLGNGARLADPFDFRNFNLVLKSGTGAGYPSTERITFVDEQNALIPIDLVLTLPGRPSDARWEENYAEMVEQAHKRGWIDAKANAIRAHTEREP